jgi:hypothetical protein
VDRAGQAGGYSSRTTDIPGSLIDFSRPWNRNTPKTQQGKKKNPSQSLAKELQTCQELTSNNTTKRHTIQANHPRQIPQKSYTSKPIKSTGQTGHAWVARDEHHPWVNSPKSNSRSPDSLHGFAQDFGDTRKTSWALHSQVMVHQNSLNQEESRISAKNTTNPGTTKTPNIEPLCSRIWERNQREKNHERIKHIPTTKSSR